MDLSADTCRLLHKRCGSVERGVMEGYLYEVDSNSGGKQSDGDPLTASETASQEEKAQNRNLLRKKSWKRKKCFRRVPGCRAALCRIRAGTTNTKQISTDRGSRPH